MNATITTARALSLAAAALGDSAAVLDKTDSREFAAEVRAARDHILHLRDTAALPANQSRDRKEASSTSAASRSVTSMPP